MAEFWFQSFQNWQSEFLAVGSIVVLSVFLRQRGSAESKPVHAPHHDRGLTTVTTARRGGRSQDRFASVPSHGRSSNPRT